MGSNAPRIASHQQRAIIRYCKAQLMFVSILFFAAWSYYIECHHANVIILVSSNGKPAKRKVYRHIIDSMIIKNFCQTEYA
jgi:hypothetical protein